MNSTQAQTDEMEDFVISRHVQTGEILGTNEDRFHGFGGQELSNAFVSCDGDCYVSWVREPVGVDERWVGGVGGGDVDCSSR